MKFNINQQDLQQALNYCQGVIEKRSTLPILSNVLLDASNLQLTITATDLDLIFIHKIKNIEVVEEGKTTTTSSIMHDIVRNFSSGKKIIPNGGETSIINRTLLDDNKNFFVNKDFLNETKKLDINPDSFCEKIISQYEALNLLDKNKNYVLTDKSLENFFFIEIIIKLLPDAKIINCERNIFQIIITIK